MKRTLITIGAVLYLAACWAPQLWTDSADAQEKPQAEVLEEVRARRFVLVDAEGNEVGSLAVVDGKATLQLHSQANGARADSLTLDSESLLGEWFAIQPDGSSEVGGLTRLRWHEQPGLTLWSANGGQTRLDLASRGLNVQELEKQPGECVARTVRSADVGPTGIRVMEHNRVRAAVGRVEPDTKTTQEGAFVSYDADGNVLWMEPK